MSGVSVSQRRLYSSSYKRDEPVNYSIEGQRKGGQGEQLSVNKVQPSM
jgi:hypothetical protein